MRRISFVGAVLVSLGLASTAQAELLFQEQAQLLTQACADGCYTNYNTVVDLDGDGALDIVYPNSVGFFTPSGTAQPLVIYKGSGTGTFSNVSATAVGGYTGAIREIAFGDVDGDGDLDMFAPSPHGKADKFFVNQGGFVFADEAAARIGGLASHAGATRFGDLDNDGDLDLYVADAYSANGPVGHIYMNDGTGKFAELAGAVPAAGGFRIDDVDLADFDGDFDLDILVNNHEDDNLLLRNDGTGHFTDVSGDLPGGSSFHYGPGVCDIDGDGDLDILVDNVGSPEQLLVNDGTGKFADKTSQITGNTSNDDNGVNCIDYDGDGDLDIVVPSLSSNGERVFANDGTGHFSIVPNAFTMLVDSTLWIDFGDLNGDGRLDAASAQGESGDKLERVYFGTTAVAVDMLAPKVISQSATTTTAAGDVVRFRLSDNAVTDVGPRLQRAWLKVGLTEIDAKFVGGDVFRAVVPAGAGGEAIVVCATDFQGNTITGCGGVNPATTSSSVSTGAAMTTTAAGMTTSSGSMSTGSGTGSGGGGGNGSDGGSGGGCGCFVGPTDATPFGLVAALGGLAIVVVRRRSRKSVSDTARSGR